MLVNRRSFLKGLGGMAAMVILPTTKKVSLAKEQVGLFYPLVFIEGKRLPANRMSCKIMYFEQDSKGTSSNPVAEFTIVGTLYGGSSWRPDQPLQVPVSVRVIMDGVTYVGTGAITRYSSEFTPSAYVYHLSIIMWDLCTYIS